MLRLNKSIISKIVLSMLLFVLVLVFILFIGRDRLYTHKTKQSSIVKNLPEFLSRLSEHWTTADLERLKKFTGKSCEFLRDLEIEESQISCNTLYFDCLLKSISKENFSELKVGTAQFIPQLNPSGSYLSEESNFITLTIFEKSSKRLFNVRLQKSCGQKKLPVGVYSAGPQIESNYVWDNFSSDVFLDRDYVSRFDLWKWASSKGYINLTLEMGEKENFFKPALNLPIEMQKEYCRDQGKSLLESRYFDAATFYPSREQNVYKFPFPWTKGRESFLTSNEKVSLLNCQNAFVKECRAFAKSDKVNFTSVSWMGLYHSLGGYAESFRNTFNPEANLKVSSQSLARSNPWHRTGLRANWNGDGVERGDFNFVEQYTGRLIEISENLPKIAFRCMEIR